MRNKDKGKGHPYDRRWQKQRRFHLRQNPLCEMCKQSGLLTPAEVVDHVDPHQGDQLKFRFGALQSLCKQCHDKNKRLIEERGYHTQIGPDGWPVDPNHPVYQTRSPSQQLPYSLNGAKVT